MMTSGNVEYHLIDWLGWTENKMSKKIVAIDNFLRKFKVTEIAGLSLHTAEMQPRDMVVRIEAYKGVRWRMGVRRREGVTPGGNHEHGIVPGW